MARDDSHEVGRGQITETLEGHFKEPGSKRTREYLLRSLKGMSWGQSESLGAFSQLFKYK